MAHLPVAEEEEMRAYKENTSKLISHVGFQEPMAPEKFLYQVVKQKRMIRMMGFTATREAEEEIGLDPSLVDVVAFLEPFLSQHLLRVIPVIGILWNRKAFNPTPSPAEVEACLMHPLKCF